jgi:exodeoxyribonuclease III
MGTCHIMLWNIRFGGGRRVPDILEVISRHAPDIAVLAEFVNDSTAPDLCAGLNADGLEFQAAPDPPPRELSVLIASRYKFKPRTMQRELPLWPYRALRGDFDWFTMIGFYVPTMERKRPVLHWLRDAAREMLGTPTLLIGDFNTGIPRLDERGSELTCSTEFREVLEAGWIDLYRVRYPESRERSFYERPWLGYRIDHALGSASFNRYVREVFYSHDERYAGISDHSSLHLIIELPRKAVRINPTFQSGALVKARRSRT